MGRSKFSRGSSSSKVASRSVNSTKLAVVPAPRGGVGPDARRGESSRKPGKLASRERLTLFRRFLILIAALFYVTASIQSCVCSFRILVGANYPATRGSMPYHTDLMAQALGNTSVQDSLLVRGLLDGGTKPRDGTLYLNAGEDGTMHTSLLGCSNPTGVDAIYSDVFLRSVFSSLVNDTAYNLTFLNRTSIELVTPVVDCTNGARIFEDRTAARFFFLVRSVDFPTSLSVLVINLSVQGFQAYKRNEMGSVSVMTLALLTDMAASSVDHHFVLSIGYPFQHFEMVVYTYLDTTADNYWKLRSVPRDASTEIPRTLLTACRSGFFATADSTQANTNKLVWALDADPKQVARSMVWVGAPEQRDSWAWVHFVHAFLAWDVLFQVFVLLVIAFRNLRTRKYWIGDAFVAISSSLVPRGFLVVASMAINKFWALKEFSLSEAARFSAGEHFMSPEILHADLLVIYLSLIGLLGKSLRVRIDPALTVAMFELGFQLRRTILSWLPALTDIVASIGFQDFASGAVLPEDESKSISPMLLWGPYTLSPLPLGFYAALLFPIAITMVPVTLLTLARKAARIRARRRFVPDSRVASSTMSNRSDASEYEHVVDGSAIRTNFELATGARLADQFGLVGDYENFKHIKGLRFASADGVYSNGFVIVNNKFLVQTNDLPTIAIMRLLRLRFRNVHVYDVHEHSVGEMARLVYPDTMTFADLLRIDINVLT